MGEAFANKVPHEILPADKIMIGEFGPCEDAADLPSGRTGTKINPNTREVLLQCDF